MGLIARLLGKPANAAIGNRGSRLAVLTRDRTRKEVLATAVRDTLKKHGVPSGTIIADTLAGSAQGRPDGVHLLLIFREWNPGLVPQLVSLEQAVLSSLFRIDPLSNAWLAGVSWRFPSVPLARSPQLPESGQRSPQRKAHRERAATRPDFEAVLGQGDAAFAKRAHAGDDFSPTLPMERQQVRPVA